MNHQREGEIKIKRQQTNLRAPSLLVERFSTLGERFSTRPVTMESVGHDGFIACRRSGIRLRWLPILTSPDWLKILRST
jgi:hypothetical protein